MNAPKLYKKKINESLNIKFPAFPHITFLKRDDLH